MSKHNILYDSLLDLPLFLLNDTLRTRSICVGYERIKGKYRGIYADYISDRTIFEIMDDPALWPPPKFETVEGNVLTIETLRNALQGVGAMPNRPR